MRHWILLTAVLAAFACATAGTSTSTGDIAAPSDSLPDEAVTLRVDNQAFPDMAIYIIEQSGVRSRLATATGNSVTTIRIPNRFLGGTRTLRFQADPIGGNRAPISEEITVSPGDTVTLTIPPRE